MIAEESRDGIDSRFYFVGGTLRPGALCYVERRADRELYEALRRGDFCYVLTPRQMGKSSLMARTAQRLREEGVPFATVDLTALGQNVTPEQWYEGLLGALGLRLDLEEELDAFWLEHASLGPLRRFMAALECVVLRGESGLRPTPRTAPPPQTSGPTARTGGAAGTLGRDPGAGARGAGGGTPDEWTSGREEPVASVRPFVRPTARPLSAPLVVFLDEIDAVRSLPFSTDEFFAAIRECYNRRSADPAFERVTFCLLGVATPSDLIRDTRTTPFNIGKRIELYDFTDDEAAPLSVGLVLGAADSLGRTMERSRSLLNRVLHWTGGHPYLTQRLCEAVAEDRRVVDAAGVDRWCRELFLSQRARDRDDNLLFVRERLLRSEVELATLLELYAKLLAGRRVAAEETNALVDVLRLSGIVRVTRHPSRVTRRTSPRLAVRNRIYARVFDREWVRQHMPDAELQRQKAAYRRGMLRASALASAALAVVGGLALTAALQAGIAREALRRRDEANAGLHVALGKEQAERARADGAARDNARLATERAAALRDALAQKERAGRAAQGEAAARRRADRRAAEALHHRYIASMNLIQRDWTASNTDRIRTLLSETRGYPGRGFEWGFWNRRCRLDRRTLAGHTGAVYQARFSPDGRRLITGSFDSTAKAWDAATGRELLTLRGHAGFVASACFSPDGRRIATAGEHDHAAIIWDATSGRELLTVRHSGQVYSVDFSPDGGRLATASKDGTAKVWDVATGREGLTLKGHTAEVWSVSFSVDGRRITTASEDGTARVWDAASGRELLTLKGHARRVDSAAFSPDGHRLVTGSSDDTAKVWDAATGRELLTLRGHRADVVSARFSPDGSRIVTAGMDHRAKVWDADTGRDLFSLVGHPLGVYSACFSPDGGRILTASADRTAKIWDAAGAPESVLLSGHQRDVTAVRFSPDSGRVATASEDGTAKLWDAASGRELLTFRGHARPLFAVDFSPDGRRVVTGSGDHTARVWDAATGRELLTLRGHTGLLRAVRFSPDGRRIVSGSGGDWTARVWDAATGRRLLILKGHTGPVKSVACSRDGRRILTSSEDGTVKVWDAAMGREVLKIPVDTANFIWSADFSPDGRQIVTGRGLAQDAGLGSVRDAATGRELLTLQGHTALIFCVAFSRDGWRIVTGSRDGTVRVWDSATGRELLLIQGQLQATGPVAISPDGRRIVTAADGGTASVWISE